MFSPREIHRKLLTVEQLNFVEQYIDKKFGPGDNPEVLVNYIDRTFGINVKPS
jgi:hypothetical protein